MARIGVGGWQVKELYGMGMRWHMARIVIGGMARKGTVWQWYEVAFGENSYWHLARKGTVWRGYEVANGENRNWWLARELYGKGMRWHMLRIGICVWQGKEQHG